MSLQRFKLIYGVVHPDENGELVAYADVEQPQAELATANEENRRLRGVLENAKGGLLEAQGSLSELGKDDEVNFDGYLGRIKQALNPTDKESDDDPAPKR